MVIRQAAAQLERRLLALSSISVCSSVKNRARISLPARAGTKKGYPSHENGQLELAAGARSRMKGMVVSSDTIAPREYDIKTE